MKAESLKSKLKKIGVQFSTDESGDVLFSLNNKKYEAFISTSGDVCGFVTSNYSKFEGRNFQSFSQVLKHSKNA